MKRLLSAMLVFFPFVACQGEVGLGPPASGMAGDIGAAGSQSAGSAGSVSAGTTGGAGTSVPSTGVGGDGVSGGQMGTTACTVGIPADVGNILAAHCIACHGNTPLAGVPASFTSYAQVTATSKSDPTKSNVALALVRVQDDAKPMPPAPLSRLSAGEIATLQTWVSAGSPASMCGDGGAPSDGSMGPPIVDPFVAAPTCTSRTMWTQGNHGSKLMNPGQACISCHSGGEGPRYAIAGTLYPSAHEPDDCNGVNGTNGARVVIIDAKKQTVTLTPDAAGNFYWSGPLATPYLAKVTYMGRERAMIEGQTSGDCNGCHTQTGAMKAPGRILLP